MGHCSSRGGVLERRNVALTQGEAKVREEAKAFEYLQVRLAAISHSFVARGVDVTLAVSSEAVALVCWLSDKSDLLLGFHNVNASHWY